MTATLRAGAAYADVTPVLGVDVAGPSVSGGDGWGPRRASVLVLDDGREPVVFAAAGFCVGTRAVAEAAARVAGVHAGRVFLAGNPARSGAGRARDDRFGPPFAAAEDDAFDGRLAEDLGARIGAAIESARASLRPARLSLGVARRGIAAAAHGDPTPGRPAASVRVRALVATRDAGGELIGAFASVSVGDAARGALGDRAFPSGAERAARRMLRAPDDAVLAVCADASRPADAGEVGPATPAFDPKVVVGEALATAVAGARPMEAPGLHVAWSDLAAARIAHGPGYWGSLARASFGGVPGTSVQGLGAWSPALRLRLLRVGRWVVVGLPGEPTPMLAGRIERDLRARGAAQVVIATNVGESAGTLATREELETGGDLPSARWGRHTEALVRARVVELLGE
ncbi:MAG: hypothetical protein ACOZNI_22925 [Myxococcota bacterium]